jgi:hypothetical protein
VALTAIAAAPNPNPTPTPVAIQYDEIQRMVVAPATPPPPGSFQDSYKTIMANAQSNQSQPAQPHGMGGMLGGMMGGHAPDMSRANGMMSMMRDGHLTRWTYYWVKQWVREDDPVAQTATITKCAQHQIINLDLAKKTYTVVNTGANGCPPSPPAGMGSMGGGPMGQADQSPGTVDLTITNTTKNLGPMVLDGIQTTGSSSDLSMQMTNATGSCKNSSNQMSVVQYVSDINKQRAYCPLPRRANSLPSNPSEAAARGGCKPTMHGSASGMPSLAGNGSKLEMYYLLSMSSNGRNFGSLTQRGNVAWLLQAQTDPLFAIPDGFTEAH